MPPKPDKSKKEEAKANEGPGYMVAKAFFWERISNLFEKEGKLKKRGKKTKGFNERYACVYFNYVLWFKTGKGPNGAPHEKGIQAKGCIELERIVDESKIDHLQEKGLTGAFVIRLPDADHVFQCESQDKAEEWVLFLRRVVSRIRSFPPRERGEEAQRKLKQVQLIFPENSFNVPLAVPPEGADKWIQDMRRYREEYKNWLSWINSLQLYAEFNQGAVKGRTKGYCSWFNNKAKGVFETINQSEESVLRHWEKLITSAPQEMEKITESMYYMDDIKKEIDRFDGIYALIDTYNAVKRDFHFEDTPRWEEEKQIVGAWLDRLKSYPYANEISMQEYTGGAIIGDEESWTYTQNTYTAKWNSAADEIVEWTCKDHQFTFAEPTYGTVLWNNKSWVWTHPGCPFLIRYDWFPSKGVFRQKIIKPQTSISKRVLINRDIPALSDWQLSHGVFRAVTVGQRNPEPEVPPVTEFRVEGSVPPPVILLAAVFYSIRDIMRDLLGMNDVVVFNGLNPIF